MQFYDDQAMLARTVVDFLAPGLAAQQSAVVVATPSHMAAFQARLAVKGFDVERAQASGRLVMMDAEESLGDLMVDGWPDRGRFLAAVPALVERAAAHAVDGQVRIYGEMVDVLWHRGKKTAALRLEQMWCDLQQSMPSFSLLCGYAFSHFHDESGVLDILCGPHTHVLPPPGEIQGGPAIENLRSLAAEIANRKEVERALRLSALELREKELTLRQTEDELRDFVENGSVALHWVGADGIIRWANRAELEFLGYREDEYRGKAFGDLHVDADRAGHLLALFRAFEDVREFPADLRAKDGSIRHVLINASPYRRHGEFVHTRCFTRDVTDFKLAARAREAQVRRAERLKTITAAVADAVTSEQVYEAVVDQVGVALGASSAGLWLLRPEPMTISLCRTVGYSEAAREAMEHLSLDGSTRELPITTAARTGEPVWIVSQGELLRRYPDSASLATSGRRYSAAVLPVAAQGRTLGVLAFTFDDERPLDEPVRTFLLLVCRYAAQALERLRLFQAEQQSRMRAELLYGLAAAVIGAERIEEVFEAALDAIERGLGADLAAILLPESAGGARCGAVRNLSDLLLREIERHPPWPAGAEPSRPVFSADIETDPVMAPVRAALRHEHIRAVAHIPLMASGRLAGSLALYYRGAPLFPGHELELAQAIANHVAAAIARFASIADLQKTVRFNEVFTGILGHDLRNPLSAILTSARLAMKRDEGERLHRPLARILNSGARMTRMIDQLLDFTRFRLGAGLALARVRCDLGQLMRQTVDELEDANPDSRVTLRCLGDLGGHWDGDRLSQVFSNLIGNALQHGVPASSVEVAVDGQDLAQVSVRVQNQGVIPADVVSTLFEPLAGGQSLVKGRGLGLGLFISRELVRAHGGQVGVVSQPAGGTVFTVVIPRDHQLPPGAPSRDPVTPAPLFVEGDFKN